MTGGQKFIARNRAPRVQIAYDVELYGASKTVELPFVMGVMADLAGRSDAGLPAIADRRFLEIDVDSFDDRMRAIQPRVTFAVPNTLTGEGSLSVDLVFERMQDFAPDEIARKVEPLRKLLEARTQLANLLTYMDGKAGAEALIETILGDGRVLGALAAEPDEAGDAEAVFKALRAALPEPSPAVDGAGDALSALRATHRDAGGAGAGTDRDAALQALRSAVAPDAGPATAEGGALAALRMSAVAAEGAAGDASAGRSALDAVRAAAVPDAPADAAAADALAALRLSGTVPDRPADDHAAGLAALREVAGLPEASADALPAQALAALRDAAPGDEAAADGGALLSDLDDILGGLGADRQAATDGAAPAPMDAAGPGEDQPTLDDLLAGLDGDGVPGGGADGVSGDNPLTSGDGSDGADAAGGDDLSDLDDLLAGLDGDGVPGGGAEGLSGDDPLLSGDGSDGADVDGGDDLSDLDDLLAGLDGDGVPGGGAEGLSGDDPLLSGDGSDGADVDGGDDLSDLDDLLAGLDGDGVPGGGAEGLSGEGAEGGEGDGLSDLDALLTDIGAEGDADGGDGSADGAGPIPADADPLADLDDLLGDMATADHPDAGMGAPFAGTGAGGGAGGLDNLDSLLDGFSAEAQGKAAQVAATDPFGRLDLPLPDASTLSRPVFRMAFLADFSGRAAAGTVETGEAIARRRAIRLDIDRLEDVIAGFGTRLVLPLGGEGGAIEIPLADMDALHPDALFGSVDLFSALRSQRQRLGGAQAAQAIAEMRDMAAGAGPLASGRGRSAGGAVPADRRLDGFADLIAAPQRVVAPSGVAEIVARAVAPHVVAAPHPDAAAYRAAVDAALTDAMRLVLHHPEFQQIETVWRSLDFLARRIETDARMEIVLYDISAEEFAADLAAQEDLSQSGIFRLLAEQPLSEGGDGGFSAVFGLYSFEETPPHAELLARMARISAWADAPFVTGLQPTTLDVADEDRHPLVRRAWDRLQALPEARWLGLCLPRFMLRLPYGRKSDPIDSFAFEEFSAAEGVAGMVWGHPAVVVAVLLAKTWKSGGRALGKIMSLGDMPFHYVTDRHGDQVALPCTERNLTLTRLEMASRRRLMALVSARGRNEVRLSSFQSLGGGDLAGPWSAPGQRDGLGAAPVTVALKAAPTAAEEPEAAADVAVAEGADDLDALLAGFGDLPENAGSVDGMDPELAALLEGL